MPRRSSAALGHTAAAVLAPELSKHSTSTSAPAKSEDFPRSRVSAVLHSLMAWMGHPVSIDMQPRSLERYKRAVVMRLLDVTSLMLEI